MGFGVRGRQVPVLESQEVLRTILEEPPPEIEDSKVPDRALNAREDCRPLPVED